MAIAYLLNLKAIATVHYATLKKGLKNDKVKSR